MDTIFTIVNPAAGGGRCGKRVDTALARLRASGLDLEVRRTRAEGHGVELARDAYREGYRRFLAVGGDGTGFELINGLFPAAESAEEAPTVSMLPLGTGNSFLRDFGIDDAEKAIRALQRQETHPCDVIRCAHRDGVLYYINLLSVGFSADAGALTNRRFKSLGPTGYIFAVLGCLLKLRQPVFPLRVDDDEALNSRACTLLSFSNSRFTGGTMMMAPEAEVGDGALDIIRIDSMTSLQLIQAFPKIFKGTHIHLDAVSQRQAKRVTFELDGPVDVMVDGEIRSLHLETLEVLPSALKVVG